jgi:hypothetical protein
MVDIQAAGRACTMHASVFQNWMLCGFCSRLPLPGPLLAGGGQGVQVIAIRVMAVIALSGPGGRLPLIMVVYHFKLGSQSHAELGKTEIWSHNRKT